MDDESIAEEWVNELFDKIYRAYNDHDASLTADCYADDLRITINGEAGPSDREAFVEALQEQWDGFPDVSATEVFRLVHGNRVVTEMTIDGHNMRPFLGRAPTGRRWHVTLAWVCEVSAGRVRSIRAYVENQPLQHAVGGR